MKTLMLSWMLSCVGLIVLGGVGCTYDTNTAKTRTTTRPADAALKDPYGKWSTVDTDITGGGMMNLNKDALQRDLDSFLLK
jgi:hypothetical protein